MTIICGLVGPTGYKFSNFNLEYQIERHVAMALSQWPDIDPVERRKDARRLLLSGQAWLHPEPKQLELFL